MIDYSNPKSFVKKSLGQSSVYYLYFFPEKTRLVELGELKNFTLFVLHFVVRNVGYIKQKFPRKGELLLYSFTTSTKIEKVQETQLISISKGKVGPYWLLEPV